MGSISAGRRRVLVPMLVVVLALGACGATETADTAPDTSGSPTPGTAVESNATAPEVSGSGAPDGAVLRLAVTPGWEHVVDPFIEGLGGTGDGTALVIDLDWSDAHADADIERSIIDAVADGELDFGLVGTRAFADMGVADLSALTAPLLVDSYALQEAILGSDIPERMLGALGSIGVTGLALSAGALRRPLGVAGFFVVPADFAGTTFHTFRSSSNAATARALGATHTDEWGGERDESLTDGTIDVTENSLGWASGVGLTPFIALDVALWPATGVLIANPATLEALTEAQRLHLDGVAAQAFATPSRLEDEDTALVAELCGRGTRVAEAFEDDLAELRAALDAVYADLAEHAATAAFIDEIEALKTTVTAEEITIPEGCTGDVPQADSPIAEGTDDPAVLNGTYRFEWTYEELLEWAEERDARGNAGILELTFEDGRYDLVWVDGGDSCPGTYGVSGDRIVMVATSDITMWDCGADGGLGEKLIDAAWELNDDGLLLTEFVLPSSPAASWFFSEYLSLPMARIG